MYDLPLCTTGIHTIPTTTTTITITTTTTAITTTITSTILKAQLQYSHEQKAKTITKAATITTNI